MVRRARCMVAAIAGRARPAPRSRSLPAPPLAACRCRACRPRCLRAHTSARPHSHPPDARPGLTYTDSLPGSSSASIQMSADSSEPIVLRNAAGVEVHLLRRGAAIQRLLVPDAAGQAADVVLGFDSEEPYKARGGLSGCTAAAAVRLAGVGRRMPPHRCASQRTHCTALRRAALPAPPPRPRSHPPRCPSPLLCQDGTSPYMGAVVGRVANRIANAKFELDGREYQLAANNGPNCLHGAHRGAAAAAAMGCRRRRVCGRAVMPPATAQSVGRAPTCRRQHAPTRRGPPLHHSSPHILSTPCHRHPQAARWGTTSCCGRQPPRSRAAARPCA